MSVALRVIVLGVSSLVLSVTGAATGGLFAIAEDTAVSIDFGSLVSDIETADGNLIYNITPPPASEGTLSGSGPARTFTPAANFNGAVVFNYSVTDRGDPDNCSGGLPACSAALTSAIKTITITVTPVNDAPVATDGTATTTEDDPAGVVIDLAALVSDVETTDANLTYNIVTGPAAAQGALSGSGSSRTFIPAGNFSGTATFTYNVTDRGDPDNCSAAPCSAPATSATKTVTITVNPVNDAPVANDGSFTTAEDTAVSIDFGSLVSDIETADGNLIYNITPPPASEGALSGSGPARTFTPAANFNGAVVFNYSVTDRGDPDNCSGGLPACSAALTSAIKTITITVTPVNDAPLVGLPVVVPSEIFENESVTLSGSFTDPDIGDTHVVTINWGDGYSTQVVPVLSNGVYTFQATRLYKDDSPSGTILDSYSVTVIVTDAANAMGSAYTLVTVKNVAPTINSVTAPVDPVATGTPVNIVTSFSDPGALDTFDCKVAWSDGGESTASASASATNPKTCTVTRSFSISGVYSYTVTVTDDDTGSAVFTTTAYLVIYPPDGHVTGGGWIDSPLGAYYADPSLIGKANFGFVSKYKKGQSRPDGQTEFQFKAGNLNFHSSMYEWLTVAGARAQFKGVGKINGGGNYGFLLTAVDGQINGGGGKDKFRIKIWDKDNADALVYDNQLNVSDNSDPTTILGGGSIVIHAPK